MHQSLGHSCLSSSRIRLLDDLLFDLLLNPLLSLLLHHALTPHSSPVRTWLIVPRPASRPLSFSILTKAIIAVIIRVLHSYIIIISLVEPRLSSSSIISRRWWRLAVIIIPAHTPSVKVDAVQTALSANDAWSWRTSRSSGPRGSERDHGALTAARVVVLVFFEIATFLESTARSVAAIIFVETVVLVVCRLSIGWALLNDRCAYAIGLSTKACAVPSFRRGTGGVAISQVHICTTVARHSE